MPVNFSDVVWESILSFEVVAYEKHVSVESDIAPECITTGDAKQLSQLVSILLDNAVKYTPPAGCVAVRLFPDGEKLVLSVKNSGAPIQPEHIDHLFDRFYRVDNARTQDGGYGLGLAIAREIADRHHGTISVESSEENGTVFSVLLPHDNAMRKKNREDQSKA